jgi:hypothetical protein
MRKLFTLSLLFLFHQTFSQQFYNRYPSPLDLSIYSVCDIAETGNAFYKIETESNNAANFHSTIRIIKTTSDGTIQWINRYDAGVDSSLQATNISETMDHQLIVSGMISNDNGFPPIGVMMMKLDTTGNITWCVCFPGFRGGYYSKNILQLDDSSFVIDAESFASLNSCLIKVDNNATAVSCKVFNDMPYTGSNSVTTMIKEGNNITLAFNYGDFVTVDTAFNVLSDKNYNLDQVGPYFVHALASNGDHLFTSDVIGGGQLEGQPRVFRTDAAGNLLWAKRLTMWNSFTQHTGFTLYDVTQAQNIFEDTSGNVVVVYLDEGGVGLVVTFDAAGNYIANKIIKGAKTKLCTDGDLLFASSFSFSNSAGIFAKQTHYTLNDCDSLVDFQYANNTDSASTIVPITNTTVVPVSIVNFPMHVLSTSTTPISYCPNVTGLSELSSPEALSAFPNPTNSEIFLLGTDAGDVLVLFDITGKKVLEQKCDPVKTRIDLSLFEPGVYILKSEKDRSSSIRLMKF